jgi:hypothetical protein
MPIAMPRVVQRPTPNYSPSPIKHDLTVLHMTEGGYLGSVAWLCDPRANASAHRLLKADASELTQLAPLNLKAWHACAFNGRALSLEIEGFTARGLADATLDAAALIAAWDCLAYGIPPVWARGGQGRGVCCHHDLGPAGGGHVDICGVGDALWSRMMAAIQNAYEALKALPSLPSFALHGAPGPHEVAPTPDVTPAPSHGGAPRNEPGDVHAHPTPSRYPAHSIAALQADLNAIIKPATPLTVDGRFGALTSGALREFPASHGCKPDGLIGSESWAALDAAMRT